MKATSFRLISAARAIREPARIESESQEIHDARLVAIKRMGTGWIGHPAYVFNPRHSNDPEIYRAARAPFLSAIARAAAEARARRPAFVRQERVRAALEQA